MSKKKPKQMDIDEILNSEEKLDMETGEIVPVSKSKLNELIVHESKRANGSVRYQLDFSNCVTMTEQRTAHLTDINYLIKKYKPDELAAYIQARNQYRLEILNHDFSEEPNIQDAMNVVYRSKQEFEALDEDIKSRFLNHVEFLKFIDNPQNVEKMYKMGILTKKQVEAIKIPEPEPIASPPPTRTPTKEKDTDGGKS